MRAGRQLVAIRAQETLERARTSPLQLRGSVVRRAAQHRLELAQGDLLLGLVAGDRIVVTRGLGLEILAGDEKLASLLVEARIELLRQLTELFALRVLGQNGELRVGRPQGKLLTVEAEPRSEQRVLECVLVRGDHRLDEAPLARLA